MTMTAMDSENTYCAHNYHPLPVVLVKGEDVWLWDEDGKKYLDMMSAYSAVSLGHSNPRIVKAITDQAAKLAITSRAFYTDKLGPFLQKLCKMSGLDMALPMNTGAEAVETAIKAARMWGYQSKNIPTGQAEIIVASDNFHGRTTTIIGFSTDEEYKDAFGPYTPGFKIAEFGNAQSFRDLITENTAAILIEPMQGEAGIKIPPKGFLKELRQICDENNVLLILDEIQTGLGRTGKMFAFQHEEITPDGLILGKALGGGMMAVSAFIAKKQVMELFTPGSHGSTFGGNPLGAAVGLEALTIMEEEQMDKRSAALGAHLLEKFRAVDSPLIREVRGSGLWVGVEFDADKVSARKVCEDLKDRGILSKETHGTVVRFAPPLTISKEVLDWAVDEFTAVVRDQENRQRMAS
ncbi:MAG: ornithine--oxo-acid transaminase [Pseudomonadota bacterium]